MFVKCIRPKDGPEVTGPFSPAIKLSDFVYLSGQLPVDPLSGEIVSGGIRQQTHQVMQNVISILEEMGLETRHIVKTTVFLTDMNRYAEMNEVYATYFDDPYPATSCVQVAALPLNAMVEIECQVIDTLKYETPREPVGCGGCSRCG